MKLKKFKNRKRKGFTLIEMVIVITIIGILSSIAVGKYSKVQENAKLNADYATASNLATAAMLSINDGNDNIIGNLLRKLEKLLNDRGEDSISLIDYVHKKSKILNYFDTVEQAKSCEKSLIGIIQLEQEKWGLDVVCLNINDKPIKVNEHGYEFRL